MRHGFYLFLAIILWVGTTWALPGFGVQTMGGSANTHTFTVTSLEDSGAGTLREALGQAEALTTSTSDCSQIGIQIDFTVSGNIELVNPLRVRNAACITVDGGGNVDICFRELEFRDSTHIIVKSLRFRESDDDGLRFWNVQHAEARHNSFRNAVDENASIVDGSSNINFLDNLVAGDPAEDNKGLLVLQFVPGARLADQVTIARNLFADQDDRSPRMSGGTGSIGEVVNNLVYEWGRGTNGGNGTRLLSGNANVVNNAYIKHTGNHEDDAVTVTDPTFFHIDGNLSEGMNPADVNVLDNGTPRFAVPAMFQLATELDASEVQCTVGNGAGVFPRDAFEAALIAEITANCEEEGGEEEGTVTLAAQQDAELDENSPNKNNGAGALLQPRSWDASPGGAQDNHRALVQFDLSSLVGQTLTSAILELCLDGISSDNTAFFVDAHRLTSAWVESEATATNASTGAPWETYFGDFAGIPTDSVEIDKTELGSNPDVRKAWDVTSDVQDMVSGAVVNHGWLLKHNPEGGGFRRTDWVSRENTSTPCGPDSVPRLVVIVQ